MQWGLLKMYHPSENDTGEIRIQEVDGSVREELKDRALFNKYLEKSGLNIEDKNE